MTDVPIEVVGHTRLHFFHITMDRRRHRISMGAWAVYVPARQMKLLHAVQGMQHCIYRTAPKREAVLEGRAIPYREGRPAEAWLRAFTTPVTRRVAENYVCLQRLHRAGIGPEPLGLVLAADYRAWFSRGASWTAGYRVANLNDYPAKPPTTEAQLRDAGVIPDRSLASIREQINGYVSDLNALYGAMPEGGEAEVSAIEAALEAKLDAVRARR